MFGALLAGSGSGFRGVVDDLASCGSCYLCIVSGFAPSPCYENDILLYILIANSIDE